MKNAFPHTGMVDAADGSGHRIYFESYGPATAPAFVMVHGNSGNVFDTSKLSMWDLDTQRVIIIHARGVGLSTPMGKVEKNLYPNLADDIETVRAHLGVDQVSLFGWSAGAAVCCLYAQKYQQHVNDVVFYGAFLGGKKELEAYYQRSQQQYPDGWKKFCTTYGPNSAYFAVLSANAFLLWGAPQEKRDAALNYERVFGTYNASGAELDRLVANRTVFANMIEQDFGLSSKTQIVVPPNAKFIRGDNDYIGTPTAGETIINNAGHDVHDPHVQMFLKSVMAGVIAPVSPAPSPQPPQP